MEQEMTTIENLRKPHARQSQIDSDSAKLLRPCPDCRGKMRRLAGGVVECSRCEGERLSWAIRERGSLRGMGWEMED